MLLTIIVSVSATVIGALILWLISFVYKASTNLVILESTVSDLENTVSKIVEKDIYDRIKRLEGVIMNTERMNIKVPD